MCAIFSSPNLPRFGYLYSKNKDRGDFAYGVAYYKPEYNDFLIVKGEGSCEHISFNLQEGNYFVGHTQAPTSSIRKFDPETSHPFSCNNITVAHNGVLTNEKTLKSKTKSPFNEVDSSVIPALINDKAATGIYYKDAICQTLSELEGTYSVWIIAGNTLYFGRAGSTLFMNRVTREFSSVKLPGIEEEVPEGTLFKVDRTFIEVGKFKANSPFFII
jgi:glucosamine 6-phosphate synthetase-like amidotransferase/phosphosugar isomerase protein